MELTITITGISRDYSMTNCDIKISNSQMSIALVPDDSQKVVVDSFSNKLIASTTTAKFSKKKGKNWMGLR